MKHNLLVLAMDVVSVLRDVQERTIVASKVRYVSWAEAESIISVFGRSCGLDDSAMAPTLSESRSAFKGIEQYTSYCIAKSEGLELGSDVLVMLVHRNTLQAVNSALTRAKLSLFLSALSRGGLTISCQSTENVRALDRTAVAAALELPPQTVEEIISSMCTTISADEPASGYQAPTTPEEAEMQLAWLLPDDPFATSGALADEVTPMEEEEVGTARNEELFSLIQEVLAGSPGQSPNDENPLFDNL